MSYVGPARGQRPRVLPRLCRWLPAGLARPSAHPPGILAEVQARALRWGGREHHALDLNGPWPQIRLWQLAPV